MIGVIVVPGPTTSMHGLDFDRSLSLLPLGDRPALQHIVESLVAQGIIRIEFIVGHAPERVEALFGNGDRWGSRFRYHLSAQPENPYRSLRVIAELRNESWILLHAERYPIVDFEARSGAETTLYYEADETVLKGEDPQGSLRWGGAARFIAGADIEAFANFKPGELHRYFERRALEGTAFVIATARWIDVASPAALLDSQTKLLNQQLRGLTIGGLEMQPDIWVSRNTIIHPTATLNPPLYIGPNTSISSGVILGPNAVIGSNCLIDTGTIIDNSLVLMGSYIGQSLELSHAIVSRSLLVNVPLDTRIDVGEGFLLARLADPHVRSLPSRIAQAALALVLILLLLPISLISMAWFALVKRMKITNVEIARLPLPDRTIPGDTYRLPCIGADAWSKHRRAGWEAFTRQFLPGLYAVLIGDLSFVGLPPRSRKTIENLSNDWRELYEEGKGGLITEASVATGDPSDPMQAYLADAYYGAQNSWQHDMRLVVRYFVTLLHIRHK